MIVEANDTVTRYVYPQYSGYRVVFDVDNMPSYVQFCLEESSGIQALYTFDNKRHLDYLYNFSHVYPTGGAFKFELVKEGTQITTWMNNVLATSADETIYFPSGVDRIKVINPSTDTDVKISFYGESPTLSFSDIYSSDSVVYTGQIVNLSDRKTRILAIESDYASFSYDPHISGGQTGTYIFSGDLLNSQSSLPIDFNFDFGQISRSVSISNSGFSSATGANFLSFSIESDNVKNDEFIEFNLSYYSVLNEPLDLRMDHARRIGNDYYSGSGSGLASGTYSGYINGSGYLESYNLRGMISGYPGSGYGTMYTYATGQVITDYTIEVVGYELGNLSTGYLQGFFTGNVGPGSGYYHFVGSIVGTPPISIWDGGINVSPVSNYTGLYDFYRNAAGFYSIYGTGIMTMGGSSSPSVMNGIQNHFVLQTGEAGGTLSDYTANSWYLGDTFSNTSIVYNSGELTDIDGSIGYINGVYGITDEALLTVSGASRSYTQTIYGSLTDYNDTSRVFMGYVVRDVGGTPTYKLVYYYPLTGVTVEE